MIRRTIREWEYLNYGSGEDEIPENIAHMIVDAVRDTKFSGHGGTGVLVHGRKALRAQGVVGVISIPECQLEILPKIESGGETGILDEKLRRRLVHMLAMTQDLDIEIGIKAHLGSQRDTILEILIRKFCQMLIEVVRPGMPRRYIEHRDDLSALRGCLDVTRQFSVLAASPQKMACRFDELSPDIPLNQVMRAAVSKLSRLTESEDNQRILRELNFIYADVADVPVRKLRWDLINIDRTNSHWRKLFDMAKMFLTDQHQQTTAGEFDGFSLLFEMNVLFEKYVAKLLSRALSGTGLQLSTQGGSLYCLYELDNNKTRRFRTKPDLIIRRSKKIVMVVDTKWKRITRRIDDQKQGVSQTDVYQLMAYSRIYNSPNVMLLYPHHSGLPADRVCRPFSIADPESGEKLFLATLDLSGSHGDHVIRLRDLIFPCIPAHESVLETCG